MSKAKKEEDWKIHVGFEPVQIYEDHLTEVYEIVMELPVIEFDEKRNPNSPQKQSGKKEEKTG